MCQNAFTLVYKILDCVDLKEKNRKQMYDQIKKKIKESEKKKFTAVFKFCLKLF